MSYTVADALQLVNASVLKTIDVPTAGGDEVLTQVAFAERSQQDWAQFYTWDSLRNTLSPTILNSMTSIGLPQRSTEDLASPVYDFSTGYPPKEYIQIKKRDRFKKLSTDRYVYVTGDDARGYSVQVNPPLASGASVVFDHFSTPSSLATTSDTVTCPSKAFMAKRIEYYILQSRKDPLWQAVKVESDNLLSAMIEKEDVPSEGENNRVSDWMRSSNFTPGED